MTGDFFIGELPDGRFVAASNVSPFFCFRGESEEAVIGKVRKHLRVYGDTTLGRVGEIRVKSVSKTVTTVQPTRQISVRDVLEAA